ncbi:MAG: caspase domain-containing protein, partial [Myxococcota bacterium]
MTHPTTLPHRWWPTAALSTAAMLVGFLALGLLWTSSSPDRAQADDRGFKMTTKELKSEKRIALVIGNANYTVGRLANPVNDARAMATALSELGFEVTLHTNLKQNAMKRAIIDFGRKLRKARGGVGLFYYAGHGMQVRGRNYLIPLGATIEGESYVDVEAVDMGQVMAAMGEARNRLNIMVLDACRNNPFEQATRSMSRGLAFTSAPQGTLIAYATSPGRVAADGAGRNGTYTEALLKHMKTPGLPIEEMFKRVRSDVISVTDQQQTPWESSSLTGRFEFVVGDKPATATTSPTVVCPEGSKRVDGRCVADVVCPSGTTFVKGRGCVAGRPTPKGRSGRNALTPQQLVSLWSSACANGKSAFYKASYKPLTGDTILADGGMGLWTLGPPVPAILSAFMKTAQIDTSKLNNHNGHSIYSSLQMLGRISGIKPNLKAVTGEHGDFFHVNPALMPWV